MKQEERQLWKTVKREGAKCSLELEKVQYMLYNAQTFLRHGQEEHPELYDIMDLYRVETEIRDVRTQIGTAQERAGSLSEMIKLLEKLRTDLPHKPERYVSDPADLRRIADGGSRPYHADPRDPKIVYKG